MANEPTSDFDLGPLSWVQGEIDQALGRGLEALAIWRASNAQGASLKHARTHVHQAAGALQMVGLDAVCAFTDEIERQLARLDDLDPEARDAATEALDRAVRKLRFFLDEVVNGTAPVPLKLYPEYEAMQKARGEQASPADLFYPELGARAPQLATPQVLPAARVASHVVQQRRLYQRGLLGWLRGDAKGARQMREALGGLEQVTAQPPLRAFWWTTGALLEALIDGGLEAGVGVKQLAARLDLQMRRSMEGSSKVADRLRREVLYYVAVSAPVTPAVDAVQRAYGLAALVPSPEAVDSDLLRIQPHLREARELLGAAKEAWLKFTSGRAENLPRLRQSLASVQGQATEIGNPALMRLTAALVDRLDRMPSGQVPEPVAMEYATAMLLAETAVENYANLSDEFPRQVDVMLARLDAAQANRPFVGGSAAPVLDEMSRRAQERLLMAQVGREIQANLRHVEQVLDAFFRDHGKRGELASLTRDVVQVRGALRMLGLDAADELLALCQARIDAYADPQTPVIDDDLELLAESLSGLGFFIEAVEQQRPDRDRLIAPLIARQRGEAPAEAVDADGESVESAVAQLRAALPELLAQAQEAPADGETMAGLKAKLAALRDDAELIGDTDLATQAKAAVRALDERGKAGLEDAAQAMAPEVAAPAAPEISAETQRLLSSTGDAALDAELLEIYLVEAAEVLDTVVEQHRILTANPGDREALRTARRQFHTLKGSGRMVGLAELGEIAYAVEKLHNRLLEEERTVTPAVLAMIGVAAREFRRWVGELTAVQRVHPDPTALYDAIRDVERELPGNRDSVLKREDAAPVATPAAPATDAPLTLVWQAEPARTPAPDVLEPAAVVAPMEIDLPILIDEELEPVAPGHVHDDRAVAWAAPRDDAPLAWSEPAPFVDGVHGAPAADALVLDASSLDAAPIEVRDVAHDAPSPAGLPAAADDLPFTWHAAPVTATGAPHAPGVPANFSVDPPSGADAWTMPPVTAGSESTDLELAFDVPAPFGVDADRASSEGRAPGESQAKAGDDDILSWDIDLDLPGSSAPTFVDADAASTIELTGFDDAESLPSNVVALHGDDFAGGRTDAMLPLGHGGGRHLELVSTRESVAPPSDRVARDVKASASAAAADDLEALSSAASGTDEVMIGDVEVSGALYQILIEEADGHLATLQHEVELMQFDPGHVPSAAMVRASHTLCGIHRTAGFPLIAHTAKALEQALLGLQQSFEPLPEDTQPVVARAVAGLASMIARIKARTAFDAGDHEEGEAVQRELEELRQKADMASMPAHADAVQPAGAAAFVEADTTPIGLAFAPIDAASTPAPDAAPLAAVAALGYEALPVLDATQAIAVDDVGEMVEEGTFDAAAFAGTDQIGDAALVMPAAVAEPFEASSEFAGGVADEGARAMAPHDAPPGEPHVFDADLAFEPTATAAGDAIEAGPGATLHDDAFAVSHHDVADGAPDESAPANEVGHAPSAVDAMPRALVDAPPAFEDAPHAFEAAPHAFEPSPHPLAGAAHASDRATHGADRATHDHVPSALEDAARALASSGAADSSPHEVHAASAAPVEVETHPPVAHDAAAPRDARARLVHEAPVGHEAQVARAAQQDAPVAQDEPSAPAPAVHDVSAAVHYASHAASSAPHDAGAHAVPTPAASEDDALGDEAAIAEMHDEVDEQLLPIFLEEAAELFPLAGEQLRAWQRQPSEASHAAGLRRTLHTFKGSARMAGAMRLGELTHRMESRLLAGDELAAPTPERFDALEADLDHVAYVLDALREGRVNVPLPWLEHEAKPSAEAGASGAVRPEAAATDASPQAASEATTAAHARPSEPATVVALPGVALPTPEPEAGQRAMLRVRADIIDRLVNEAGEVSIARARVEGELRALKANLLELTNSIIRMRNQVREIEIQGESQIQSRLNLMHEAHSEFDPLEFDRYTRFQELTRSLAEGVNDVSTVQQSLLRNLDDADAALVQQSRLSRDLQQQLFSIRTVPFGSLSERLYRILRQVAKELDKRANLEIRGAQVELDRSVLEKLVGPLEHLLRNALDHGLEPRDARLRTGKSATGEIALTVRQVGNEIAIELSDDGSGLDFERIRARAVSQGRIAADAEVTEAQLVECIFQPGFSTASRITQVSGRGIGMDVVRAEIAALGGRVEVTSRPGQGTSFLVYLPLTLAVAQAVLVRAGGRLWALPAPMVEQVQQVRGDALGGLYASGKVEWQERSYPFHYLPRLLGDREHSPTTARHNPVLLLRTGQGFAAVQVDEMVGNQEVVVKNIGPQLARVSGIAGATVLGNGEIVLIINPVQLAQRSDVPVFDPEAEARVASRASAAPTVEPGPPLVLVVDDSLTVRKITSRLLAREGFRVATAKDGLDALEALEAETPDVILLDIEMPRMDGFEFTRTIKADTRHANVPIVMITSRTAEKHRNRARELGVDLYLGKPYQEEELLRHLREMLALAA